MRSCDLSHHFHKKKCVSSHPSTRWPRPKNSTIGVSGCNRKKKLQCHQTHQTWHCWKSIEFNAFPVKSSTFWSRNFPAMDIQLKPSHHPHRDVLPSPGCRLRDGPAMWRFCRRIMWATAFWFPDFHLKKLPNENFPFYVTFCDERSCKTIVAFLELVWQVGNGMNIILP